MKVYPRGAEDFVTRDFRAREYDCPCNACHQTIIDDTLASSLQNLRDSLSCPIHITSGFRCDEHQDALFGLGYDTALGRSQHQDGKAADIATGQHTGTELATAAKMVGFKAIGIGKHFIHVDTRDDKEREWTYNY